MKSFKEFVSQTPKLINYPMAKKHKTVFGTIPKGKALPKRSSSSAGGDGGNGE